jgi:hypothetical protein
MGHKEMPIRQIGVITEGALGVGCWDKLPLRGKRRLMVQFVGVCSTMGRISLDGREKMRWKESRMVQGLGWVRGKRSEHLHCASEGPL